MLWLALAQHSLNFYNVLNFFKIFILLNLKGCVKPPRDLGIPDEEMPGRRCSFNLFVFLSFSIPVMPTMVATK